MNKFKLFIDISQMYQYNICEDTVIYHFSINSSSVVNVNLVTEGVTLHYYYNNINYDNNNFDIKCRVLSKEEVNLDDMKETLNNNGVISNEFVSIFIVYSDIDIANIKLQVEEVSEAKWCTKEELNEFVKNEQILPHIREYEILNEILK